MFALEVSGTSDPVTARQVRHRVFRLAFRAAFAMTGLVRFHTFPLQRELYCSPYVQVKSLCAHSKARQKSLFVLPLKVSATALYLVLFPDCYKY